MLLNPQLWFLQFANMLQTLDLKKIIGSVIKRLKCWHNLNLNMFCYLLLYVSCSFNEKIKQVKYVQKKNQNTVDLWNKEFQSFFCVLSEFSAQGNGKVQILCICQPVRLACLVFKQKNMH